MKKKQLQNKILIGGILLAIILFTCYVLSHIFLSNKKIKESVCRIERLRHYALLIDGKERIYFQKINQEGDFIGYSTSPKEIEKERTLGIGFWVNRYPLIPSCNGLLITSFTSEDANTSFSSKDIYNLINRNKNIIKREKEILQHHLSETDYYLKVHSVSDEGYNNIARYHTNEKKRANTLLEVEKILNETNKSSKIEIKPIITYKGIVESKSIILEEHYKDTAKELYVLQTQNKETPSNTYAISILPWKEILSPIVFAATYMGWYESDIASRKDTCSIVPGKILRNSSHNFPHYLVGIGSPIFNRHGIFIGCVQHKKYSNKQQLNSLIKAI